jgi:hypothetical protein
MDQPLKVIAVMGKAIAGRITLVAWTAVMVVKQLVTALQTLQAA